MYCRFKPNGDEIIINSKDVTITERYNSEGLNVFNISANIVTLLEIATLNVTDSGNYTLQVKKDHLIERVYLTLNVTGIEI